MAKKEKKIDVKKVAKAELSREIAGFLAERGFEIVGNPEEFGFTEGTIVVREANTDVQIKFITPKAGVQRYEAQAEDAE